MLQWRVRKRVSIALTLAFSWAALIPGAAWAGYVVAASGNTPNDGPIAATAVFTAGNGYIQVVLSNTQSGNGSPGQAVSQFFFQVANGLSTPTGISNISGNTIRFDTSPYTTGSVSTNKPGDVHWGFATQNGVTALLDVSSPGWNGPGGQPQYMIIGPNAGGGPLENNFDPYFNGSATFIIADKGVTANTVLNSSNITNVVFGFGTGPEAQLPGGPVVPAPPSIVLLGIGGIGLAGFLTIRSRRPKPAAA
jgi:hypothetical protein